MLGDWADAGRTRCFLLSNSIQPYGKCFSSCFLVDWEALKPRSLEAVRKTWVSIIKHLYWITFNMNVMYIYVILISNFRLSMQKKCLNQLILTCFPLQGVNISCLIHYCQIMGWHKWCEGENICYQFNTVFACHEPNVSPLIRESWRPSYSTS